MSEGDAKRDGGPSTPILVKHGDEDPVWPGDERLAYLVARGGLYRCRQNEFFRSCVRAPEGPSELPPQAPFFEPRFPRIPAALIERAVGFFSVVADLHGSEAAALFAWNRGRERVELIVPEQTATMGGLRWGDPYPVGVHYRMPTDLPEDQVVFADIHSHVHAAAYASHTDKQDELHSAGLHFVVGRIHREPPELHVEAVVDGHRFLLQPGEVIEGYGARDEDVPQAWLDRVEIAAAAPVVYPASWPSH